ncbi:hypothetical protein FSP39_016628 [Pinctada imbricata]|uniref:WD repeat-containing protein 76 n=1 Tax=Pinctada imbricata TaxID=66713 RepID=A0AA88YJZ3_PINIB|nr:hypothetical protein FSP39_016628 [Pinctada imbricata]
MNKRTEDFHNLFKNLMHHIGALLRVSLRLQRITPEVLPLPPEPVAVHIPVQEHVSTYIYLYLYIGVSLRLQRITPEGLPLPPEPVAVHVPVEEHPRNPPGPLQMTEYMVKSFTVEEHNKFVNSLRGEEKKQLIEPSTQPLSDVVKDFKKLTIGEKGVMKVVADRTFSLDIYPGSDRVLAAAGNKWGKLGFWDVLCKRDDSFDGVLAYTPHSRPINCTRFSPYNWSQVFTSSYDGTLRSCDIEKGVFDEIYSLTEDSSLLKSFDFLSAHSLLVSQQDGDVALVDTRAKGAEAEHLYWLHDKSLRTLSIHPVDKNIFVTASTDNHDNHTGRWLTNFRPTWHPTREDLFVVGSMARPRQIELYGIDGSRLVTLTNPEFLGSVCSLNVIHPTRNVVSSLHIGMTHHHHTDGATYSVHTDTPFSKTMTFFITLKYRNSVYLLTYTGNTLHYTLPLILKPACHLSINVFVAELMQEIGGVSRIYKVTGYSGTLEFRTYLLCITVFNQRKDTLIKLLQIPGIDVCQVIMTTPLSLERGDKCHILVEGLVEIPCTSTKSYKLTCSAGRHFRVSRELMYSDGMVLLLEKTVSNIPQSSTVRTRIDIKTSVLYNDWCNLYFADFYCHKSVHYVTLVITKPGSEADVFCCPRLPLLDNYSNPFLTLHRNLENETTCYVCLDPHVEVFYTDKLDIINILRQNLGCMTSVEPRGTGHSNPEGIPKNKSCTVCNV